MSFPLKLSTDNKIALSFLAFWVAVGGLVYLFKSDFSFYAKQPERVASLPLSDIRTVKAVQLKSNQPKPESTSDSNVLALAQVGASVAESNQESNANSKATNEKPDDAPANSQEGEQPTLSGLVGGNAQTMTWGELFSSMAHKAQQGVKDTWRDVADVVSGK